MNNATDQKPAGASGKNGTVAADVLGWVYIAIGVATIIGGLGLAAVAWIEDSYFSGQVILLGGLMLLPGLLWMFVGLGLRKRRYWWYCFVLGVLTIPVVIPVGTALGIYTILLLNRPGMRAAFQHGSSGLTR